MPCSPISIVPPTTPSGPPIPGFGVPSSLKLPFPPIPFPSGFPEDLLGLFSSLQLLIPPGALTAPLGANFGKNVFDSILKLLDQFMPFLMLYKFFLPVLNLIICIIEVLCALLNPFALPGALSKLFGECIPAFLNLFPIFALVIMIISLLILLLALVEYLIEQVLAFITSILRNINALVKAFQNANATSVLAISNKLGALLCAFSNLFVILSAFGIIIQIIKDILSLAFSIPPCDSGGPGTTEGCCAPQFCPTITQNTYTNTTGVLQYLPEAGYLTDVALGTNFLTTNIRTESWQIYDPSQTIAQAFWNIVDGYDISNTINPKPVFFPTDANYNATTNPQQAAYTVDLRLFYNPAQWGRPGSSQYIRFQNCIVLAAPTQDLEIYNNTNVFVPKGVLFLAGGTGYLDDGITPLTGYGTDGVTPISSPATLENFLHMAGEFSSNPVLLPSDGYTFSNAQYTFKPNFKVLLQKNLVVLGCEPSVAMNRIFVNNVLFSGIAAQTFELNGIVNNNFPDPDAAQQCLLTAVSNLSTNMTTSGVAEFQTATSLCLNKLQSDTKSALSAVIGVGFNPCESEYTLNPPIQFTTQSITVTVNLNENNGISITSNIPSDIATSIARDIKATPTFGTISPFIYDGYQSFIAELTSNNPGSGQLMISFQNQILCTNTLPTTVSAASNNGITTTTSPNHTLQITDYKFIYTPHVSGNIPSTGDGDNNAQPRRDYGDISRDSGDN